MNQQFKKWLEVNYKWLTDLDTDIERHEDFEDLPFSMRWGVYLEFFDLIGFEFPNGCTVSEQQDQNLYNDTNSRLEAQEEVIKKAFEILNK